VVDAEGGRVHGGACYQRGTVQECRARHDPKGALVGFLDKVTKMASDGLEKGQEVAKTQQLKLEVRKLDGQLDESYAALGRKAFDASQAGTLSTESLTNEIQAVRDAQAAIDAKQAEIAALGESATDDAPATADVS
jgi:hypothetical protein